MVDITRANLYSDLSLCKRLLIAFTALIVLYLFVFLLVGCYMYEQDKILFLKTNTGKKLYVQYGDIFDINILGNSYQGRKNVVVPVNRCFDTIVDNDLISDCTLHGKFMKSLYEKKLYDDSSLSDAIQNNLSEAHLEGCEILQRTEKRKGNTTRYPVGTIAELRGTGKDVYFLLGLSKFDKQFTASTSLEEFVTAVQKLVEFCYARSQGSPVIIPVFGTELSRVGIGKQEALRFIVDTFKMNKNLIVCDIYIVVYIADREDVSIYDL